jgi:hypothetical protein
MRRQLCSVDQSLTVDAPLQSRDRPKTDIRKSDPLKKENDDPWGRKQLTNEETVEEGANCGDEAWLLCGLVEKPTDDTLAMLRHNGRPQRMAISRLSQPALTPGLFQKTEPAGRRSKDRNCAY